jgi:hypothetical protein
MKIEIWFDLVCTVEKWHRAACKQLSHCHEQMYIL